MLNTKCAPWPSFTEEEAETVQRVLLSNKVNYWTGGEGRAFEQEFAEWCGADHAVALANGTVALDLALKALGIGAGGTGAGDEVIVTPRSFIASVSSVVNAGAKPVFADVDRDSQCLTAATIEPVLSERTRAIIAVHLAGWPCDMDAINALACDRGLLVIEDCAQAHGALYNGRPVGSLGAAAAWSFCQDKIMTTGGEGGMFTTSLKDAWLKAWAHKDHGKSWEAVYEREHPPGFRWLHESFGTNWRMTEMQSAIGRIQLRRMADWQRLRERNAETIMSVGRSLSGLRVPEIPDDIRHAWYKAYVFVRPEALKDGWSRDRIMNEICARGAPCFSGSCSEIYLEKAFDGTGFRPAEPLPVARELGETSLMFLVHPTLSEDDMGRTVDAVEAVMSEAQR